MYSSPPGLKHLSRGPAAAAWVMWLGLLLVGCPGAKEAPPVEQVTAPEKVADPDPTPKADGPVWRPGYVRPPVIDVHGHIMPSGFVRFHKVMKENNLRLMVNLSGGSSDRRIATTVEMTRLDGRLLPFYSPRWRYATEPGFGKSEAARLEGVVKKAGFRGLKIPKVLGLGLVDALGQRIPVDWPELDPLWAKAGELGVPVAIHTGDPKAFWDPLTPQNERYAELSVHPGWSLADPSNPSRAQLFAERNRVILRHPKTTFICVHFGNNPEDLSAVDGWLNAMPNMMIDTSARLPEIGRHPAKEVREFFVRHRHRILFGTDLGVGGQGIMLGSSGLEEPTEADIKPFYDAHWRFFEGAEEQIVHPTPIQGAWKIDAIHLPDDVLEDIYWKNAVRVLKLRATF